VAVFEESALENVLNSFQALRLEVSRLGIFDVLFDRLFNCGNLIADDADLPRCFPATDAFLGGSPDSQVQRLAKALAGE